MIYERVGPAAHVGGRLALALEQEVLQRVFGRVPCRVLHRRVLFDVEQLRERADREEPTCKYLVYESQDNSLPLFPRFR